MSSSLYFGIMEVLFGFFFFLGVFGDGVWFGVFGIVWFCLGVSAFFVVGFFFFPCDSRVN